MSGHLMRGECHPPPAIQSSRFLVAPGTTSPVIPPAWPRPPASPRPPAVPPMPMPGPRRPAAAP